MKMIAPSELVAMNEFCAGLPVRVDLAYGRADNLLFGEQIYRPGARLWLHRDLADIVRGAAIICHNIHGFHMVLYDGLRTIEAQGRMLNTARVQQNPHWLQPPRLLSPPGKGGHPRGMAIDLSLESADGTPLDMGTPFDFLAADPSPAANRAHRDHPFLSAAVKHNREILCASLLSSAAACGLPLLPLPQEWWDFRLPPEIYESYAPLSDSDLPDAMRMGPLPSVIDPPVPRP